MQRRPRVRHRSATKNLVLFALAVVLLLALIYAVAKTRRMVSILPPESAEAVARRLSPDNAYAVLAEALELLPVAPPRGIQPDPKNPKRMVAIVAAPGSVAELLNIERPDDDPELAAYLDRCEPALAKAREAFAKPYFLLPIEWKSPQARQIYAKTLKTNNRFYHLGAVLVGRAIRKVRAGDGPGAFRDLMDAARLGQIIGGDGKWGVDLSTQRIALTRVPDVAAISEEAALKPMIAELEALHAGIGPPKENLEFLWRLYDHPLEEERIGPQPTPGAADDIGNKLALGIFTEQRRRSVVEHRKDLQDAAALSYADFQTWRRDHSNVAHSFLIWDLQELVKRRTSVDTYYRGAIIAVGLEIYKRAHGDYPDALAALAPEILDAVPNSPFTGAAFAYKRQARDYSLFTGVSPAESAPYAAYDVVIHAPAKKDKGQTR